MLAPNSSRLAALRWLAVGSGLLMTILAHAQLSFTRLGALTYPTHVSGDGAVVVGRNYPGYDLFRWTKDSGAVLVTQNAFPGGLSTDGQTMLVNGVRPTGGIDAIYRWTAGEGFTTLASGDSQYLFGAGLSGDGQIAVGNIGRQAVRWDGTTAHLLGDLPAGSTSFALGISEDGETIVGYFDAGDGLRAFRWTEATGMIGLGLTDGVDSSATNVSADGTFIVGYGMPAAGPGAAFLWNEDSGIIPLGPGMPTAVSADGSLVIGSYYAKNFGLEQGFVWSPASGFREFPSVLRDDYGFGATLDDWQNLIPTEMSADGRYIVGYGLSVEGLTEGWLLDRGLNPPEILPDFTAVPEPGTFGSAAATLLFGLAVMRRRRKAVR